MPQHRLRLGQPVDREAFNKLADQLERKMRSAVGIAVHDGQMGAGFTPDRDLEPVWAVILKAGTKGSPNFFTWKQVYPANDGTFQLVEDSEDFAGGYKSQTANAQTSPYDEIILNPAVEINGGSIELNTIVRLLPTRVIVDTDGNVHRAWLFSNPQGGIRPFKLTGPMINAGGGGIGTSAEKDLTAGAEFLDNPGEEVTLYPAHRAGFPAGDEFFALGIGRGPGNYFRGTYGWAKWVAKATASDASSSSAGDEGIQWQGEWQIVTLYADLIQQVRVYDATIEPGERGKAQLWWIDKHVNHTDDFAIDPVIKNSTWQIELFNDLDVPLVVGTKLKAYFSRPHYVWVPLSVPFQTLYAKVQTNPVNQSGATTLAVSVKSSDWKGNNETGDAFTVQTQIRDNQDTALFADYIVQYHVLSDGTKVIENDIWDRPIGQVIWESVDVANIRDGWRLCDGSGGAPDLRGRFIMHIDDSGLGEADEDDIGDTGGFRKHGPTENNHDKHTKQEVVDTIGDHDNHSQHSGNEVAGALDDHDPHTHDVSSSDPNVSPAGAFPVVESGTETSANITGMDHSGSGPGVTPLPHSAHTAHVVEPGDHDLDHSETDNRPRYYVFAALQRFE